MIPRRTDIENTQQADAAAKAATATNDATEQAAGKANDAVGDALGGLTR